MTEPAQPATPQPGPAAQPTDVIVHLRRPDGHRLDSGDALGLLPGTLIVVEIGPALITPHPERMGQIIGWIPPGMADLGRPMLTGACSAVNGSAQQHLAPGPANA